MVSDGPAVDTIQVAAPFERGDNGNNAAAAVGSAQPAVESSSDRRKAALAALVAKKREVVRIGQEQKRVHEDATTEAWSGLSIENHCVRREKWDAGMRGKHLVPFYDLNSLRPKEHNQVVIGVLCTQPVAPRRDANNEKIAEWRLTNLDKIDAQLATLVIVGRAMEHWALAEGAGHSTATVGSIFGILNPESAPGRPGAMRVSFDTQILKLGTCPSLAFCTAKRSDGIACRAPCNTENESGYCYRHANMSHGSRQHSSPKRGCVGAAASSKQRVLQRPAPAPLRAGSRLTEAVACIGYEKEDTNMIDSSPAFGMTDLTRISHVFKIATDGGNDPELLAAIEELEAAVLRKQGSPLEPTLLSMCRKVYAQVGTFACQPDTVGVAAKRLRRSLRAILDDRRDDSETPGSDPACRRPPPREHASYHQSAKRSRINF